MRSTFIATLLFASSILGAPAQKRDSLAASDLKVINHAIDNIRSRQVSLKQSLEHIVAVPRNVDLNPYERDIILKGQDLTDALVQGSKDVRRVEHKVSLVEATSLTGKVQNMQTQTNQCTQAWLNARVVIVGTGGKEAALKILHDHEAGVGGFTDALVSKMPFTAQEFSRTFGVPVMVSVKTAIEAYKKA